MTIYSIYILNKAGGLIYQNDLHNYLNKVSSNTHLIIAGTLHGVHAIASKITPAQCPPSSSELHTNTSGLQSVETELFRMFVYQTFTGMKIVLVTSPQPMILHDNKPESDTLNRGISTLQHVFNDIYLLYSHYVMKNPFYQLEMPIRCELFEAKLLQLLEGLEK